MSETGTDILPANNPPACQTRGAWPWSLLAGFSLAWLIGALYAFSHIEIDLLWWLALIPTGLLLAAFWCIMTVLEIIVRVRGVDRPILRRRWAAWLATPLMGALGLWLAQTDADLLLRLRLSEAALSAHAQRLIDTSDTKPETVNAWVGLFHVGSAQLQDDGTVRYSMQWPGIFSETGLIYDPDRATPKISRPQEDRHHLTGPWVKYIWSD